MISWTEEDVIKAFKEGMSPPTLNSPTLEQQLVELENITVPEQPIE